MVTNGSVVHFEYTLWDENGEVLQSTKGKDPVTYIHGQHEIIPGLEKGLAQMEINEEKSIHLRPQQAYGKVDPKGFKEVPRGDIPVSDPQVGMPLSARGPQGKEVLIQISEVKQDTVVLDFNHPLAGKTLHFDVKVLRIEPNEPPPPH